MDMPFALMAEWPRGHFVVLFCFVFVFQDRVSHHKVGFELACYVVKDDDELSVRLSLSASSTEIASMSCHTQLAQRPQADHVSMQHLWKAYACVDFMHEIDSLWALRSPVACKAKDGVQVPLPRHYAQGSLFTVPGERAEALPCPKLPLYPGLPRNH